MCIFSVKIKNFFHYNNLKSERKVEELVLFCQLELKYRFFFIHYDNIINIPVVASSIH